VQFFAINTQEITERQRLWLKQALETSRARWKVVYGHVPYINTGVPEYVVTRQIEALFGEMRNRADVYLAGHHHAMEHLKPIDGVQLFVSGGGGAPTYEVNRDDPRALFARQSFGFLTLQADVSTLAIRFYDASAQEIYRYSIRK
jgi:phosphodiesterase/alkaline phosphatase D-like protein